MTTILYSLSSENEKKTPLVERPTVRVKQVSQRVKYNFEYVTWAS